MKTTTTRSILLLFPLILTGSLHLHSASMDLYLQPDLQSEKLQTVESGDPRLGPAAPVLDEISAAVGWHFAEFNGTINGFVPDSKIGKDLFPVDEAIIYSGPSSSSPVITVYHTGDELEIIDTGAWWEVRLNTSFPVYFLTDPPSELPPVTGVAVDSVIIDDLSSSGNPQSSGIVLKEKPFPQSPADITGQSYQGVFIKSKKSLGLFAPKAPFQLKDPSGSRIAWVDLTGLIIPGTVNEFLDETVIIFGEREFDPDTKEWIIHARNMRVK
jgi:hypothetical protein